MKSRLEKLVRLMLDPGTPENEATAALLGARRVVAADPTSLNGEATTAAVPVRDDSIWRTKTITFGKYRGWTLGAIRDQHPDYIMWAETQGMREPTGTFIHMAYQAIMQDSGVTT